MPTMHISKTQKHLGKIRLNESTGAIHDHSLTHMERKVNIQNRASTINHGYQMTTSPQPKFHTTVLITCALVREQDA